MTIFDKALKSYDTHHTKYKINNSRIQQLIKVTNVLNKYFTFDTINSIETGGSHTWNDGMVGYYFANLSKQTNGRFISVDIDPSIELKVPQAYKFLDPEIEIDHITDDSINFLKNLPFTPNLVHLDSWDVNLKNPLPSALHGWREFEAIESKMPVGSIIIIDDNWYKGNWVEWVTQDGQGNSHKEIIDITYPIIGKGAHIYQWLIPGDKNWKILDTGYKIIIQKQW